MVEFAPRPLPRHGWKKLAPEFQTDDCLSTLIFENFKGLPPHPYWGGATAPLPIPLVLRASVGTFGPFIVMPPLKKSCLRPWLGL